MGLIRNFWSESTLLWLETFMHMLTDFSYPKYICEAWLCCRKGCDNFSYQKITTCPLVLFFVVVVLLLVQCQTSWTAVHWMWFWNPLKISIICHLASPTWDHFKREDYAESHMINKWTYCLCIFLYIYKKLQIYALDISAYFRIYGEKDYLLAEEQEYKPRNQTFCCSFPFPTLGK